MGFFNRQEAKWKARMAMRGAYPHPMLVTLVYMLLSVGVTALVMRFVTNPFDLAYQYMWEGRYEISDIYRYVFTAERTTLFTVVQLLIGLYGMVVGFGYTSYCLRLARGEQPGYRNLLDGFAVAGRVLAAGILMNIFANLWAALGLIPYVILMVISIMTDALVLLPVAFLFLILAIILATVAGLRYRLTYYFLLDNPEMGAMEAIRHSKAAMKGWKGSAFLLELSFVGWMLLVPFTFGILALWLHPYIGASDANFYDHVVHGAFGPQTDGTNPGQPGGYHSNYDGGPQDPGAPF